jgi:hypothetical protein
MKITKTYLRQVIQEELSAVMSEADAGYYQIGPPGETPSLNKDAGEISDIEGKLADFEAKKLLKSVLEYKAWNQRRGDKPNEDAKRLAMQEIYRIFTVNDSRDRLMRPLSKAEKNDPSYGGVPPNARMLDNAQREAVKKVFNNTVKAMGDKEYEYIDLYNAIMAL